ncbi:MAG TPA: carboxypeptidase regulatory-like domain-containing protein, partial [Acidimicrobiales bacterium]|nr:carboxypeptidase regulatory-like domain-containing protein [Acidimicrobiales bacterium]
LTFSAPGYGDQTLAQPLGPGQDLANLAVAMAGGAGTVSGTVTDATAAHAPLGNVTVTVDGGTAPVTTQSLTAAASPNFTLSGLPPGSYTLTFSLAGYQSQTIAVQLTGTGAVSGLSVALAPATGAIAGTVSGSPPSATVTGCDPNGKGAAVPLGGVAVTATNGTTTVSTTTTTSPAGQYAIGGLTVGSWTVTYAAPGCSQSTALVQVAAGSTSTSDVSLRPPGAS